MVGDTCFLQFLPPGLSKLPSVEAKEMAFELAQKWIKTNWVAYDKYEAMFEKVIFPLSVT